jgi:hypothetical protein
MSLFIVAGDSAEIWLIVMQWLSAGSGGYLAGRLRAKGVGSVMMRSYFALRPRPFLRVG